MQDETVRKLMQISVTRAFQPQEYICFEGQLGDEMYIVLKGEVGVYVTSTMGTQVEVAKITAGDFFGEMAIFDSLPRSASCIALDDVVCVAIGEDNIERLVAECPEITLKMLENMSSRIRKLDNSVYKNEKLLKKWKIPEFAVPTEYCYSHETQMPPFDPYLTETITAPCPICGKSIEVVNVKRKAMSLRKQRNDGRIIYKEFEPLWFDIWVCPHCSYSNHYLNFFLMDPFKKHMIERVLKEKHRAVLKQYTEFQSIFDQLFMRYIRAIHINESINPEDNLQLGKLWLNLYWLFEDSDDKGMWFYTARKASEYLEKALEKEEIQDDTSFHSIELTLASLYSLLGNKSAAIELCENVLKFNNNQLKKFAFEIRAHV